AARPAARTPTTSDVYAGAFAEASRINSNDVLATIIYPENGRANVETYTYNALGQVATKTERNGSTHAYSYDVLGRQTTDAVTALGAGVDGKVLRLETAFDTGGRPNLFTRYDDPVAGNMVN